MSLDYKPAVRPVVEKSSPIKDALANLMASIGGAPGKEGGGSFFGGLFSRLSGNKEKGSDKATPKVQKTSAQASQPEKGMVTVRKARPRSSASATGTPRTVTVADTSKSEPDPKTEPKVAEATAETPDIKPKNPVELSSSKEAVFIGDSIAKGFGSVSKGSFVGKSGKTSAWVLAHLKENKDQIKGKKMAVVQCGDNDGLNKADFDPETTMKNIREIVQICKDAGISNISVPLHLPYGAKLKDSFNHFPENALKISALIKTEYSSDPLVNIIDLYSEFVDPATGLLKEEYDSKNNDGIHNWGAYREVVKQVSHQSGTNLSSFTVEKA